MLHVALYQPVIPPNVGNISRQCAGMGARLHLIGPLILDLSANAVRRAGLDYWEHVDLVTHASPEDFLTWLGPREPWLVTKHASLRYDQAPYRDEDVLLLGNENHGLPEAWRERWQTRQVRIPMRPCLRSYNLSNATALVLAQASLTAGLYDMPERWT